MPFRVGSQLHLAIEMGGIVLFDNGTSIQRHLDSGGDLEGQVSNLEREDPADGD